MPLLRNPQKLLTLLRRPLGSIWPVCQTCGRYLDSVNMVEGYPGESQTVKVLGKHHGSEELVTIDMLSQYWDEHDMARAIRDHDWFKPSLVSK